LVQRWKWKMSNGDILGVRVQISFLLLCLRIVCALRHWEGALATVSRAIIFPRLREGRPLLRRKRKYHFDCCFFVVFPWRLLLLFDCCVVPSRALRRWEGTLVVATRTPSHHLSLSERRAPSPQEEKKKPFWLLFLSCLPLAVRAEALQRRRHCIVLCDCVLAPLAADVWCLVTLWLRAHTERRKKAFFLVGIIFAVTRWHARHNLPAGECACWRRARRRICFMLSLLGGAVGSCWGSWCWRNDNMVPLKILWCFCDSFTLYLL